MLNERFGNNSTNEEKTAMNVLFLSISYPDTGESNLYSDLMQEFAEQGHNVVVLCSRERRHGRPTQLSTEAGLKCCVSRPAI